MSGGRLQEEHSGIKKKYTHKKKAASVKTPKQRQVWPVQESTGDKDSRTRTTQEGLLGILGAFLSGTWKDTDHLEWTATTWRSCWGIALTAVVRLWLSSTKGGSYNEWSRHTGWLARLAEWKWWTVEYWPEYRHSSQLRLVRSADGLDVT